MVEVENEAALSIGIRVAKISAKSDGLLKWTAHINNVVSVFDANG
jgi:hypothetical protein